MKAQLFALAVAALACAAPQVHARTADMKSETTGAAASGADKAPTAQQNKMIVCQRQASEQHLDGAARQAYVTDCLKAKPAAASAPTQGQKLGACSKEAAAKGLKGEERNRFLSTCAKS